MAWNRSYAALLASMLIAGPASGYEPVDVANGGTIVGTVSVADKGLKDETLEVTKDTSYCGGSLPAEKYIVSANGRLQNSVVMIESIPSGKPLDTGADIVVSNEQCRFVPHVMVAPKGAMMKVKNEDPVLHNSHFYLVRADKKKNVINLALPKQGLVIAKKKILRKPGLLSVQCDAHNFMQAWVWVLEHPYGAVTPADGSFKLDRVPPGTYKLRIWHEALGEKTVDVTVEAGKTASVDIKL